MRVLSTVKFSFLRMSRDYVGLLLLLALPIVCITIFSFVLPDSMKEVVILHTFAFQMAAGAFSIDYVNTDFFTPKNIRIYILPFNKAMYAYSIIISGTVFNILFGIITLLYSQFVLGLNFTNLPWIIFINSLVGIFSSIVGSIFIFCVNKLKIAERMIDVYVIVNLALIGLFVPIPENIFFNFINTYINPLAIAISSIYAITESDLATAWHQVTILLVGIFILFNLMIILGRRKIK